jgi:chromosomal replication initiator protein
MQLIFDFPNNPQYRLDNFVICDGNRTATEFVKRIIETDSEENLLYLYGPQGSGKTHLLTAISKDLSKAVDSNIPLINMASLTRQNYNELFSGLKQLPVLLIDDIDEIGTDANLQIAIWQLFNDFHSTGRKIVITASSSPKEIKNINEHLISRLLWGLVVKIDISDDTSRKAIMKKLAEDRQVILPEDVIDYLLLNIQRDIPPLTVALDRIKEQAFITKRKISLKLAKEAMAVK